MRSVSGPITVGIDIGTTATKAVAVDSEGTVLARSRVGHKLMTPASDLLEHDAGAAWRRGPVKALAEVTTMLGGAEPSAVCVAGMVPSLAAVNSRGFPCSPGLLYGDRRGRPEIPGADEGPSTSSMPDAEGFVRWAVRTCPGARGYWPAQARQLRAGEGPCHRLGCIDVARGSHGRRALGPRSARPNRGE